MDKQVTCNDNTLDSLISWYNRAGDAQATDNSGEFFFSATLTQQAVIDSFNFSGNLLCGNTGIVSVGFFALDTCGNSSLDTSYAYFSSIDDVKPKIDIPASSVTDIQCTENVDSILANWINQHGGAQASDDCSDSLIWNTYIWQDNAGNSGMGIIGNSLDITIDNSVCNWSVNVSFIVEDLCGNVQATTASFSTQDTITPHFIGDLPEDITVSCDAIPDPDIVQAFDECNGLTIAQAQDESTQDTDPSLCGHLNYTITRTFIASDPCGRTVEYDQLITVVDTVAPGFIAPLDITIDCQMAGDTSITGTPFIQFDNCPNQLSLSFTDDVSDGDCAFTITRFWELTDACGSATVIPQIITVVDETAPIITIAPKDTIVACDLGFDILQVYQDWIDANANAVAVDDCNLVSWFAAEPGSYDISDSTSFPGAVPAGLRNVDCAVNPGLIKESIVDFVTVDLCGNAIASSARFEVWDTSAPQVTHLPQSFAVQTSGDDCGQLVTLPIVEVADNCAVDLSPVEQTINLPVQSPIPGADTIPVESISLSFGPFFLGNTLANGNASLKMDLINIDGDAQTEYFEVFAEDNLYIGNSALSLAECESSSVTLDNITPQNINSWSDDGFIDFRLVPNVPLDSMLAINDICGDSRVEATLSFDVDLSQNFNYELSINQSEFKSIDHQLQIDTFLSVGSYTIEF